MGNTKYKAYIFEAGTNYYGVQGYNHKDNKKEYIGHATSIEEAELLHSRWVVSLIKESKNSYLPKGVHLSKTNEKFRLLIYIGKRTKCIFESINLSAVLRERLKVINSLIDDI